MSVYLGHRNALVRLENNLLSLMKRIDQLRAAGVHIPQVERDALAKVKHKIGEQINEYQALDPTWSAVPEREFRDHD